MSEQRPYRLQHNARMNAEGLWRCGGERGCGRYLEEEEFSERNGRPWTYCKTCMNRLRAIALMKRRMKPAVYAEDLRRDAARKRKERQRATRRHRKEVSAMGRALLEPVRAAGLTKLDVERVTGVRRLTQRKIERGDPVCDRKQTLDRLLTLQRICRELPPMRRGQGSPPHPHLAYIQRRYNALRDAT